MKFYSLAYWSQDSSSACNMNRDIGYSSWSLSCQNKHNKKTTCSVLIESVKNQYIDVKWTPAAKYISVDELKVRNHNPIIKETVNNNAFEAMTEIQQFSEIKDDGLRLICPDVVSQWCYLDDAISSILETTGRAQLHRLRKNVFPSEGDQSRLDFQSR